MSATLIVVPLDPSFDPEMLGFLPSYLGANDKRPAKEQFHENYNHGGGWRPMDGWDIDGDVITYPGGDPPLRPLCVMIYREEWIYLYPYSWVRIGTEICRMD